MIQRPGAAVVAAQHGADDPPVRCRGDGAETGVALEKRRHRLPRVRFGEPQSLDALPQLHRSVVVGGCEGTDADRA